MSTEEEKSGSLIVTPNYVGPNRRTGLEDEAYQGPERRSEKIANIAFAKAVHHATLASTREITKIYLRRLVWLLIAVVVAISAAVALPVALNSDAAKQAAVRKNCELVTRTASVFTGFVEAEIALRKSRSVSPNAPLAVREFDKALVDQWEHDALPALKTLLLAECTGSGAQIK